MGKDDQVLRPIFTHEWDGRMVNFYSYRNDSWCRLPEIALGLGTTPRFLTEVYEAHREKFNDKSTAMVTVAIAKGTTRTRIFNVEGICVISGLYDLMERRENIAAANALQAADAVARGSVH